MAPRISLVRPSVGPSVRPSVRRSVRRSVLRSVGPSVRPSVSPSDGLVFFSNDENRDFWGWRYFKWPTTTTTMKVMTMINEWRWGSRIWCTPAVLVLFIFWLKYVFWATAIMKLVLVQAHHIPLTIDILKYTNLDIQIGRSVYMYPIGANFPLLESILGRTDEPTRWTCAQTYGQTSFWVATKEK